MSGFVEASHTLESQIGHHVVSHMPIRDWCRHCVAGVGFERRHQKHPGHDDQLSERRCHTDVRRKRIDEQERSLRHPLRERELRTRVQLRSWQSGVDVLESTQETIRSDGDPAVTLVAAAVGEMQQGQDR